MSDTGQISTPPPKPTSGSGTTTASEQTVTKTPEEIILPTQTVAVTKLALRLEKLIRETKLEGEIIRIDTPNKEIHIRTPQGEIVISQPSIEEGTPQLSRGQLVTVILPAGSPPQTADIQIHPIPEETIKIAKTQELAPLPTPPALKIGNNVTAIIASSPPIGIEEATKITVQNKPIENLRDLLQKISQPTMKQIQVPTLPRISTTHLINSPKTLLEILRQSITSSVTSTDTIQQSITTPVTPPDTIQQSITTSVTPPDTIQQSITTSVTPPKISSPLSPPLSTTLTQQKLTPLPAPLVSALIQLEDTLLQTSTPTDKKMRGNLDHLKGQIFQLNIKEIPQSINLNTEQKMPPLITGVITEHSPKGLPIITIQHDTTLHILEPGTKMVLQTSAPISEGTIIGFTAEPMTPEQYIQQLQKMEEISTHVKETTEPLSLQPLTSTTWPSLQEIIQIADKIAQPAIAAALRNTIPSPSAPARILPTTIFFLAALRIGSIENWLGEKNLDTLRQAGRKDLITRLSGDFTNIAKQSQETLSGEWRGIPIPLLHNDDIEMMHLFSKQQNDPDDNNDEGKKSTEKTTRFILNLKLSKMGGVQLDGFLRHQKTLDVFLRTANTLPSEIRQNILKAFQLGLEQAGLESGQLVFQSNQKHWINIKSKSSSETQITI